MILFILLINFLNFSSTSVAESHFPNLNIIKYIMAYYNTRPDKLPYSSENRRHKKKFRISIP